MQTSNNQQRQALMITNNERLNSAGETSQRRDLEGTYTRQTVDRTMQTPMDHLYNASSNADLEPVFQQMSDVKISDEANGSGVVGNRTDIVDRDAQPGFISQQNQIGVHRKVMKDRRSIHSTTNAVNFKSVSPLTARSKEQQSPNNNIRTSYMNRAENQGSHLSLETVAFSKGQVDNGQIVTGYGNVAAIMTAQVNATHVVKSQSMNRAKATGQFGQFQEIKERTDGHSRESDTDQVQGLMTSQGGKGYYREQTFLKMLSSIETERFQNRSHKRKKKQGQPLLQTRPLQSTLKISGGFSKESSTDQAKSKNRYDIAIGVTKASPKNSVVGVGAHQSAGQGGVLVRKTIAVNHRSESKASGGACDSNADCSSKHGDVLKLNELVQTVSGIDQLVASPQGSDRVTLQRVQVPINNVLSPTVISLASLQGSDCLGSTVEKFYLGTPTTKERPKCQATVGRLSSIKDIPKVQVLDHLANLEGNEDEGGEDNLHMAYLRQVLIRAMAMSKTSADKSWSQMTPFERAKIKSIFQELLREVARTDKLSLNSQGSTNNSQQPDEIPHAVAQPIDPIVELNQCLTAQQISQQKRPQAASPHIPVTTLGLSHDIMVPSGGLGASVYARDMIYINDDESRLTSHMLPAAETSKLREKYVSKGAGGNKSSLAGWEPNRDSSNTPKFTLESQAKSKTAVPEDQSASGSKLKKRKIITKSQATETEMGLATYQKADDQSSPTREGPQRPSPSKLDQPNSPATIQRQSIGAEVVSPPLTGTHDRVQTHLAVDDDEDAVHEHQISEKAPDNGVQKQFYASMSNHMYQMEADLNGYKIKHDSASQEQAVDEAQSQQLVEAVHPGAVVLHKHQKSTVDSQNIPDVCLNSVLAPAMQHQPAKTKEASPNARVENPSTVDNLVGVGPNQEDSLEATAEQFVIPPVIKLDKKSPKAAEDKRAANYSNNSAELKQQEQQLMAKLKANDFPCMVKRTVKRKARNQIGQSDQSRLQRLERPEDLVHGTLQMISLTRQNEQKKAQHAQDIRESGATAQEEVNLYQQSLVVLNQDISGLSPAARVATKKAELEQNKLNEEKRSLEQEIWNYATQSAQLIDPTAERIDEKASENLASDLRSRDGKTASYLRTTKMSGSPLKEQDGHLSQNPDVDQAQQLLQETQLSTVEASRQRTRQKVSQLDSNDDIDLVPRHFTKSPTHGELLSSTKKLAAGGHPSQSPQGEANQSSSTAKYAALSKYISPNTSQKYSNQLLTQVESTTERSSFLQPYQLISTLGVVSGNSLQGVAPHEQQQTKLTTSGARNDSVSKLNWPQQARSNLIVESSQAEPKGHSLLNTKITKQSARHKGPRKTSNNNQTPGKRPRRESLMTGWDHQHNQSGSLNGTFSKGSYAPLNGAHLINSQQSSVADFIAVTANTVLLSQSPQGGSKAAPHGGQVEARIALIEQRVNQLNPSPEKQSAQVLPQNSASASAHATALQARLQKDYSPPLLQQRHELTSKSPNRVSNDQSPAKKQFSAQMTHAALRRSDMNKRDQEAQLKQSRQVLPARATLESEANQNFNGVQGIKKDLNDPKAKKQTIVKDQQNSLYPMTLKLADSEGLTDSDCNNGVGAGGPTVGNEKLTKKMMVLTENSSEEQDQLNCDEAVDSPMTLKMGELKQKTIDASEMIRLNEIQSSLQREWATASKQVTSLGLLLVPESAAEGSPSNKKLASRAKLEQSTSNPSVTVAGMASRRGSGSEGTLVNNSRHPSQQIQASNPHEMVVAPSKTQFDKAAFQIACLAPTTSAADRTQVAATFKKVSQTRNENGGFEDVLTHEADRVQGAAAQGQKTSECNETNGTITDMALGGHFQQAKLISQLDQAERPPRISLMNQINNNQASGQVPRVPCGVPISSKQVQQVSQGTSVADFDLVESLQNKQSTLDRDQLVTQPLLASKNNSFAHNNRSQSLAPVLSHSSKNEQITLFSPKKVGLLHSSIAEGYSTVTATQIQAKKQRPFKASMKGQDAIKKKAKRESKSPSIRGGAIPSSNYSSPPSRQANLDAAVFPSSQAPRTTLPKMKQLKVIEGGGAPLNGLKKNERTPLAKLLTLDELEAFNSLLGSKKQRRKQAKFRQYVLQTQQQRDVIGCSLKTPRLSSEPHRGRNSPSSVQPEKEEIDQQRRRSSQAMILQASDGFDHEESQHSPATTHKAASKLTQQSQYKTQLPQLKQSVLETRLGHSGHTTATHFKKDKLSACETVFLGAQLGSAGGTLNSFSKRNTVDHVRRIQSIQAHQSRESSRIVYIDPLIGTSAYALPDQPGETASPSSQELELAERDVQVTEAEAEEEERAQAFGKMMKTSQPMVSPHLDQAKMGAKDGDLMLQTNMATTVGNVRKSPFQTTGGPFSLRSPRSTMHSTLLPLTQTALEGGHETQKDALRSRNYQGVSSSVRNANVAQYRSLSKKVANEADRQYNVAKPGAMFIFNDVNNLRRDLRKNSAIVQPIFSSFQ